MSAKVLVGTPAGDTMPTLTATDFAALMAVEKPLGTAWIVQVGSYIEVNQNTVVQKALASDYTHVMFIDSDMRFPPDIIRKLLARKKDIIGCDYRMRVGLHEHLTVNLDGVSASGEEFGVQEVSSLASGMLLVRRKVFETLKYPWFYLNYQDHGLPPIGNDRSFCLNARDAGFSLHCDFFASRDIKHIGQKALGWQL